MKNQLKDGQFSWSESAVLKVLAFILGAMVIFLTLVAPAGAVNYVKGSLMYRDFSGQDLTKDNFDHANLRYSNLSHANMRGVRLFGAFLQRANLEGADLSYAVLDSAYLKQTNLKNAVLEGAFAMGAEFDDAIIDGADFTDALLNPNQEEKLCEIATGTNPTTGRNTKETLFCF